MGGKAETKEIFNSIRNKASQCSDKACFTPDDAEVITESRLKQIVDEAEAKWEEDCERADFEWRINEVLPMLEEKYLYGTASLIKAMADALGIKISEVK